MWVNIQNAEKCFSDHEVAMIDDDEPSYWFQISIPAPRADAFDPEEMGWACNLWHLI